MNTLQQYINLTYPANPLWFTEEVKQPYHVVRVGRTLRNYDYIQGKHEILSRPDIKHKNVEFQTAKLMLNTINTIFSFHASYILGRPVNLVGSKDMTEVYANVYRKGKFNKANYALIDNMLKFGDAYEYLYVKNGKVVSHLIAPQDSYPIYDVRGEYVGFIEYYHDLVSNIESYTIYSDGLVETWDNTSGNLLKKSSHANLSGLPIHYKNTLTDMFGRSLLSDLKPILDEIELVLSRLDDATYTLSLNPLGVISGQQLSDSANSDAVGTVLSLEDGGQFQWATAQIDSNAVKLLLDNLYNQLWTIACVPSIVMGQSNVANVSEVSLKLLFSLANSKGIEHGIFLNDGFESRHEQIQKLLAIQGITFGADEYVSCEFNRNQPSDDSVIITNLSTMYSDGVLSKESYIDKSPLVSNTNMELQRLGANGDNV